MLPSAIRPKPIERKKTFGDCGYVAGELFEKKALLDPPQRAPQVSIDVLEAQKSGIHVCVNSQSASESHDRFQRVLLRKLKTGFLRVQRLEGIRRLPGNWRRRQGFFELGLLGAQCTGSAAVFMEE